MVRGVIMMIVIEGRQERGRIIEFINSNKLYEAYSPVFTSLLQQ